MPTCPSRRLIRLLCGLVFLVRTATFAGEKTLDFEAVEQELQGPVQLTLVNGNQQTGRIAGWDEQRLRLEVDLGAGSAGMTFEAEQIAHIRFPGDTYLRMLGDFVQDPERHETALDLFRAFYKQRGAYFRFMTEGERQLFVRYARYALENNKPLRAIAMIEVLKPHIEDEAVLASLDDSILLSFALAGMDEEAEAQAQKWIAETDPGGASALGWRIMTEILFKKEQFEEALWTALNPIAFSNQIPTEHLDTCYAFAIASAKETHQPELRKRLSTEMHQRGFAWPKKIKLLEDYEPEASAPEPPETPTDEILDPVQTPAPIDPLESLPTRISLSSQTDDHSQ